MKVHFDCSSAVSRLSGFGDAASVVRCLLQHEKTYLSDCDAPSSALTVSMSYLNSSRLRSGSSAKSFSFAALLKNDETHVSGFFRESGRNSDTGFGLRVAA